MAIIISSALIITGVVFLFIINYGVKVPDAVTVYTDSSKTYIQATLNENSNGYIFKFNDGENEIKYETKNNLLCADNLIDNGTLSLGTNYDISVCYKNDYENGYSNFSKATPWLASQFLATPYLYVMQDYDFENDKIYDVALLWDYVENADRYVVYYSCGNEILTYETMHTEVDLSLLEGGEHNFYVVATSKQDKYINSSNSNAVIATVYHDVLPFATAVFDKTTKQLIITTFEDVNDVEVWLGTNELDGAWHHYPYFEGSTTFTKLQVNTTYQFTIKINAYLETQTYIAVRPKVSGYNVYTSAPLLATIK